MHFHEVRERIEPSMSKTLPWMELRPQVEDPQSEGVQDLGLKGRARGSCGMIGHPSWAELVHLSAFTMVIVPGIIRQKVALFCNYRIA